MTTAVSRVQRPVHKAYTLEEGTIGRGGSHTRNSSMKRLARCLPQVLTVQRHQSLQPVPRENDLRMAIIRQQSDVVDGDTEAEAPAHPHPPMRSTSSSSLG